MAPALSDLAQRGYHVLDNVRVPGGDGAIAHLVIGPGGVFAVEEGRKPTSKVLETVRQAAYRASLAVAHGQVEVVPVLVTPPREPTGVSHGVLMVQPEDLVACLEGRPHVFDAKQCHGLAARAKVVLAQPAPAAPKLETVKPPSRLPAVAFVLLVMIAFAAGVAVFANSVLNSGT